MRSPYTHALARSRAYALFGQLYRSGLTPELLPVARSVPDLAKALPVSLDTDAAAADHYDLFSLNVFPFAAVYLDASGMLGGTVAEAIGHRIRQAGYVPAPTEPDDHIGHILGAMALLGGAEADALSDDRPDEAARVRQRQRDVLDTCLLDWLPAFTLALRREAHPFYTALADLTLEFALDHRATLGPASPSPDPSPVPPLLDDPHTGLKDVAHYLATPPWCGLFLSRDAITRLGRADRLPRGFGNRVQTLTNLLRAAVDYDHLPALLGRLNALLHAEEDAYHALPHAEVPGLTDRTTAWLERLAATRRLLARLRTATPDAT